MIMKELGGKSGKGKRSTRRTLLVCCIILIGGCVRFEFTRISHVKLGQGTESNIQSVGDDSQISKDLIPAGTLCVEAQYFNYDWRRRVHLERRAALQGCQALGPISTTSEMASCAICYSRP